MKGTAWAAVSSLVLGCGSEDAAPAQTTLPGPSSSGGAGGVSGVELGGAGLVAGGGGATTVASAAGSSSGGEVAFLPETALTPVADCSGQPDMTTCEVATDPDRSYDVCVAGVCVSPGCGDQTCNVPGPHFPIPSASIHDAFELVEGDEPIVVDLVTGLHWTRCAAGQTGRTCAEGDDAGYTWDEALAYCDQLSWGGFDDWYLPDAYELGSFRASEPPTTTADGVSIEGDLFPSAAPSWTTHYVRDGEVFQMSFTAPRDEDRDSSGSVRCARRGSSRSAGWVGRRFTEIFPGPDTEKVIEDASTGLVWQGCIAGRTGRDCFDGDSMLLSPTAFQGYCDELSWAGYDDWRLPSHKELHSIAQYPPALSNLDILIDDDVFGVFDAGPYLATSDGHPTAPSYGLFDLRGAGSTGPNDAGTHAVMCVR